MPDRYDYNLDLHQIVVERRNAIRNRNVGAVSSTVLKEGQRVSKIAIVYEILSETGEHHHFSLKLETLRRNRAEGWKVQDERHFSLDDTQEIGRLITFLATATGGNLPDSDGRYVVLTGGTATAENVVRLLEGVQTAEHVEVLRTVLEQLNEGDIGIAEFEAALTTVRRGVLLELSAAARLVEYRRQLDRLKVLIEADAREADLQQILEENPWMFGSEYSELLQRRTWVRDDIQDFMLRRTVDGYLEIIEIKRASQDPLFRHDQSHDSWYASQWLSMSLGQALRYIERIDRRRDAIIAEDNEDPVRVRARIFIGRDGDTNQKQGLHRLNGDLHRVEIYTYDQLVRTAERVLSVFAGEINARDEPVGDEEDLCF